MCVMQDSLDTIGGDKEFVLLTQTHPACATLDIQLDGVRFRSTRMRRVKAKQVAAKVSKLLGIAYWNQKKGCQYVCCVEAGK